jgi:hypothetical protein
MDGREIIIIIFIKTTTKYIIPNKKDIIMEEGIKIIKIRMGDIQDQYINQEDQTVHITLLTNQCWNQVVEVS